MCEDLTGSLSGGTVTCTNGNNFQSQCTLSCIDGFVSSTGTDSVLTCGATGVWSGIRIVCFGQFFPPSIILSAKFDVCQMLDVMLLQIWKTLL